jgi:hypothetical protein
MSTRTRGTQKAPQRRALRCFNLIGTPCPSEFWHRPGFLRRAAQAVQQLLQSEYTRSLPGCQTILVYGWPTVSLRPRPLQLLLPLRLRRLRAGQQVKATVADILDNQGQPGATLSRPQLAGGVDELLAQRLLGMILEKA